jgi:hypothetical protein
MLRWWRRAPQPLTPITANTFAHKQVGHGTERRVPDVPEPSMASSVHGVTSNHHDINADEFKAGQAQHSEHQSQEESMWLHAKPSGAAPAPSAPPKRVRLGGSGTEIGRDVSSWHGMVFAAPYLHFDGCAAAFVRQAHSAAVGADPPISPAHESQ